MTRVYRFVRRIRYALPLILCLVLAGTLAAQPPAEVGEWSNTFDWPVVAIHTHLLPNGKVISWERKDTVLTTETHVWDPQTGKFEKFLNPYASVFCSGHAFLPDGKLLVAGGHHYQDGNGEKTVTFFDSTNNQWTKGPDMNAGRWYPTACTLSNGEVLVLGGTYFGGHGVQQNTLPQVWKTTGGWRDLTDADGEVLPLYPWMLLAPNGQVFYAGPETSTRYLDTSGTGKWAPGPPSKGGYRDYGSAVMYQPGKVLIVGGGEQPPARTAEIIDLNASQPAWAYTGEMAFARRQMNATLLPDGQVLVTGGTSSRGFNNAEQSVFAAEVWNPATGQWKTLASMSVKRLYHSTALLLPDGRVLSAGGGMPPADGGGADNFNAQTYSPPYLFQGDRPKITSAPRTVQYGATFTVQTPEPAGVARVTWVRLGSVTHAFDQNQRFNELRFSPASGGLTVTAPADPRQCPPGHYMMFLLNSKGVPSEASIIHISGTGAVAVQASASPPIPDVEVLDQDGRKLRFYTDLIQGKSVVLNFVYTSCDGLCPMLGRSFSSLQSALGDRLGRDVHLVSVSTDPATDTPERLKAWGAQWGARPGWELVTGDKKTMDQLLEALRGDPARTGDHSAVVLLGSYDKGVWVREFGLARPARYIEILDSIP
jgi:cytochrome oxidase Cu insertion factor (SCO1/SenC/PrrC family)